MQNDDNSSVGPKGLPILPNTLPQHLSSPPILNGVCAAQFLVFRVVFVDLLSFFFGHCVVCSLIYGFQLPLWYLQTLLIFPHMHTDRSLLATRCSPGATESCNVTYTRHYHMPLSCAHSSGEARFYFYTPLSKVDKATPV